MRNRLEQSSLGNELMAICLALNSAVVKTYQCDGLERRHGEYHFLADRDLNGDAWGIVEQVMAGSRRTAMIVSRRGIHLLEHLAPRGYTVRSVESDSWPV